MVTPSKIILSFKFITIAMTPDLDWTFFYREPWITYNQKNRYGGYSSDRIDAIKLFADFDLIQGSKENFNNPVVLHLDYNYLNFKPENLEWCDASDQRYINFQKNLDRMRVNKDMETNGIKRLPPNWDNFYGMQRPNAPFTLLKP